MFVHKNEFFKWYSNWKPKFLTQISIQILTMNIFLSNFDSNSDLNSIQI